MPGGTMKFPKKVKILGEGWKIRVIDYDDDDFMDEEVGGYCDAYTRTITVRNYAQEDMQRDRVEAVMKHILRHELVHAFLGESGLWSNSLDTESWATNEEMVDWCAKNIPKIAEAYRVCGV